MIVDRIRKTKDFQDVFRNGRKIQGKIFSLYVVRDAEGSPTTAGITVAKKHVAKAVKRNYIRRVVNASFRENAPALRSGCKVVVKMTRGVDDIGKRRLSRELRKDLDGLFAKAGIVR
ncbi:MAG: ribonuclease P protein component [Candidatus Omnitrophota bacterium]